MNDGKLEFINDRNLGILFFILALFIGGFLRLSGLHHVPGLEHDESLICMGAASIARGESFPLTGDKVYEGPILEYLIGFAMLAGDSTVFHARMVLAVSGLLVLILLFNIGRIIEGYFTAGSIALIAAVHPWCLASSRVIYACNLSILFLSAYIFFFLGYLNRDRDCDLVLSGFALGLAAQGRLSSLVFAIPVLLLVSDLRRPGKSFRAMIMFLLPILVMMLPILLYNSLNDWPLLKVFMDPAQGHFIGIGEGGFLIRYLGRVSGYLSTLHSALNCSRPWLDFETPIPLLLETIPILTGLGFLLFLKDRNRIGVKIWAWFLLCMAMVLFIVPAGIKPISGVNFQFHPHYLDLAFPFLLIFTGYAMSRIAGAARKRILSLAASSLILCIAVAGLGYHDLAKIWKSCKEVGGPGRWKNVYEHAARQIRKDFRPDAVVIAQTWIFGMGYPQLKFLLPDFQVIPYLGLFTGLAGKTKTLLPVKVITVSESMDQRIWKMENHLRSSGGNPLNLWSLDTPGFWVEGDVIQEDGTMLNMRLHGFMKQGGEWTGTGEVAGRDLNSAIRIQDRFDAMGRIDNLTALIPKVTPRHREELDILSLVPVSHGVRGFTVDGGDFTAEWVWSNGKWKTEIQLGGLAVRGTWKGAALFY